MNIRVGLMTFHAAHNYGSVLQAYATQKNIENLGYDCEIINYRLPNQLEYYNKLISTKFGKKAFLRGILSLSEFLQRREKREKFESFIHEKLRLSNGEIHTFQELSKMSLPYATLVTGSDQVWNTHCTAEFANEPADSIRGYFLDFGPDSIKRIAYSASIGSMSKDEIAVFQKQLQKYDAISVREKDGAEIISRLLNRSVENTLDPTLLLNRKEWLDFAGEPKTVPQNPYIFVYTLTKSTKQYYKMLSEIKAFAKRRNLEVVCVSPFRPGLLNGVKTDNACGPLDFLQYLANASLVITDSFHGTAFSINLEVPFYTLNIGRDFRKQLLLEKVKLFDRLIHSTEDFIEIKDYSCDFTESRKLLEKERECSIQYLRNALAVD